MALTDWLACMGFGRGREEGLMTSKLSGPASARDATAKGNQPHEPALDPPFEVVEPARVACPLVFSSPHSGNVYPRRFLEAARLDETVLRRSEDAFVDALFGGVAPLGAPPLNAPVSRAFF